MLKIRNSSASSSREPVVRGEFTIESSVSTPRAGVASMALKAIIVEHWSRTAETARPRWTGGSAEQGAGNTVEATGQNRKC